MITTLTGTNVFARNRAVHQMIESFVAEYTDMGLEQLDAEEASYDRIREAIESVPFLAPKKLVVIRSGSLNKDFAEHAPALLESATETTDVLLIESKLDKRSAYYKYLQKHTDYREFGELDEQGMSTWLVAAAKEQGGALSSSDARYLVQRVGLDQQLLANELDKLVLYDTTVTRVTIDLMTEAAPQSTIFDLMDAAFSGNLERALRLYAEQRKAKVEPQQIIAMMAWQLHVLAVIKAAGQRDPNEIARAAKLNPFVVKKSGAVVRRLTIARLRELVRQALQLDTRLKSESLDADDALQHYIIQLAQ